MLIVVGTPIGNLQDWTYRAVHTLQGCHFILCEDTRTSQVLLKAYHISTPLLSFHRLNERRREGEVIDQLREGKVVGLISDSGTPGICDPGTQLITRCHQEGIKVQALPGPSAFLTALSLSGWADRPFQFVGFLENKPGKRKKQLINMIHYQGISICYETPHRVLHTLDMLAHFPVDIEIFLARELTKIHEEILLGTPKKLWNHFRKKDRIRGEFVLILSPSLKGSGDPLRYLDFLQENFSLERKEALKIAAKFYTHKT